ncbi:MAG: hypothetical protein JJT99_00500 [Rhodobacteraceae bacterium]|nr:hypothetical protein [Paracoccaceae bacterium]
MTALRQLRHLVVLLAMLVVIPAPADAGNGDRITPEMVRDALQGQGYAVESFTRTLLGRARIVASKGEIWREVVLDISTGQILRDYAVEFTPSDLPQRRSDAMPRGGTMLEQGTLPDLRN